MKKTFLAVVAVMASSLAFAQVDSTGAQGTSADSTSAQGTSSDSTSQAATSIGSDSTSMQVGATTDSAGISDEDLRKYAVVMDSVNSMKQNLLAEITEMVKGNEKLKTARYNELSKAAGDEAKLKELKATPEEVAFIKQVQDKKNEGASQISETFQTLARDYIGVEVYNEIKDSLASDTELKSRYDQILSEVQSEGTATAKEGAKAK